MVTGAAVGGSGFVRFPFICENGLDSTLESSLSKLLRKYKGAFSLAEHKELQGSLLVIMGFSESRS